MTQSFLASYYLIKYSGYLNLVVPNIRTYQEHIPIPSLYVSNFEDTKEMLPLDNSGKDISCLLSWWIELTLCQIYSSYHVLTRPVHFQMDDRKGWFFPWFWPGLAQLLDLYAHFTYHLSFHLGRHKTKGSVDPWLALKRDFYYLLKVEP